MAAFIDETLRDGPQSLWATRVNTRTVLEAATLIDRTGVARATAASGATFETAVRFLKEDPWERLRRTRGCLARTPMEVLIRGRNLFGWSRYPDEVVRLLLQCLQRAGTDHVKVFDGLNDIEAIAAHCRIAKELGLGVTGMLTFSLSPVHTDAHFAAKARRYAELGVDAVLLCDASGILRPERARTVLAAIRQAVGPQMPIEFYAHASMGLAHDSYREALRSGVAAVTTAALPLANGESLPDTAGIARIAAELGLDSGLDTAAVESLDDYMSWATYREGHQPGAQMQFDPARYERFVGHQIPGGMISNFRNQLREAGLMHRLDEVLAEAARVRSELGYPVMVTPFSQFVGVQAVFNVIQGERYRTVPDEVRQFALGHYGSTDAPIDPNVLDRILQGRSAGPVPTDALHGEPMLDALKRAHGPFACDEDLLLQLFYGRPAIEALKASAAPAHDVRLLPPLHVLIAELARRPGLRQVAVSRPGLRLEMAYTC
ncbi:MAG: hypothetical protein AB7S98_12025 [Burkholderiaceae bacterium]